MIASKEASSGPTVVTGITGFADAERDPAGRVLTQTSQGKDRKAVTRQYRYDTVGRRTHASCADRKLHWVYNTLGQITEHHQDQYKTAYGYGPGGRIEKIELPDGTTVHYHYDP